MLLLQEDRYMMKMILWFMHLIGFHSLSPPELFDGNLIFVVFFKFYVSAVLCKYVFAFRHTFIFLGKIIEK